MVRAATSEASGETREAILVAALRAFAEKGFDGATTREIASRAGVNHGLIPYYFGTKPKLWQAAVDRAFAELEAGLGDLISEQGEPDQRERTRLLIRRFVHFVARNPEFVQMMHDEGKRRGPRMRWIVDRHVSRLFAAISEQLRGAQAGGWLPADIAPIHFHYIIAGSVSLIFHQAEECKRLTGIDPFDDEVVEAHARAVEFLFFGRDVDTAGG